MQTALSTIAFFVMIFIVGLIIFCLVLCWQQRLLNCFKCMIPREDIRDREQKTSNIKAQMSTQVEAEFHIKTQIVVLLMNPQTQGKIMIKPFPRIGGSRAIIQIQQEMRKGQSDKVICGSHFEILCQNCFWNYDIVHIMYV